MQIKSIMLRFDKLLGETPKAYLIRVMNKEHWIPKSQCRKFITNKKLGGNVTIPPWLYIKITGIKMEDMPTADADLIIEKHVPVKREPVKTFVEKQLTK